ncbi:chemotaxis protein CheA [Pseudohongiella spirulinae]|uniref:Chemotaxis protein CheA n=1 Tax=Pseudohongiella spirulinae TaxID=1249552 RepID=A0A0S2KDC4_9GAMM|nr:chemotaxis protein CheA [Pseudohongiella spirulinae]ALO46320.1 Chemotaxis protein CheA [Pseudohongiella spirulinae]
MSFFDDEEILEDFLVEAGEILEQLSEQLVDLEKQPDDKNLLNAIFRGFHTVKGGAGFLQLNAMVDCCHVTENLFDNLRNGHRHVTPELMDIVLQALDTVNEMFAQVKERHQPDPAPQSLLDALQALASGEDMPASVRSDDEPATTADDEMSDAEFDELLAALDSADIASEAEADKPASDDEISEEEFEALLDQLQGKAAASDASAAPQKPAEASSDSDEITDDEFEALLDQLHGAGSHKGIPQGLDADNTVKPSESSSASPKPRPELKAVPSSPPPSSGKAAAAPAAAKEAPETTVRVDTRRLDEIMNMVGELVLVRNRLVRIGSTAADEMLSKAVANLDLVTADLQTSVMKTRMQPIKKVFGRFPRVVRDLARSLKKEVSLELHGEETDLDKNLVEALADPLVHLVRNAVDHGIELPEVREKNGKPRQGTVLLTAEQEGDHILLTICDDGNGMDPEVLRRKAVEKGLMDKDAADRLSRSECFDLIFAPGFSTKTEVSDVSGRGVGMDVVKTKISQLNGSVVIDSNPGKGSRIEIKVPLTLAIMPTLMIVVADQTFALPLANVNEIFNLDLSRTHIVDGQQVVTVRDKALPLFHLRRWLSAGGSQQAENATEANVVIVSVGAQRVGFVVDTLIGQEEVVIKPLGRMLHGTPGMAGATITGDGRIAVILDVPGLLKRYAA